MTLEDTIDMAPIKEKLKNYGEHNPEADGVICEFAAYLGERLNPELVPIGFIMGAQLALYDLQKGVNGFTNQPINSSLVGYPPQMYAVMAMSVPKIAADVCPEDFAKGVQEAYDAIMAR